MVIFSKVQKTFSYSFQYKADGKSILFRKGGYNCNYQCVKVIGREFVAHVCTPQTKQTVSGAKTLCSTPPRPFPETLPLLRHFGFW